MTNGMLEQFGNFDDLNESFYDGIYDPNKKEEFLILTPTHLVIQPSRESHKIRITVDHSNLNGLFSKGNNMLPPIHEKVAELRVGSYILALDFGRNIFRCIRRIRMLNVFYIGRVRKIQS